MPHRVVSRRAGMLLQIVLVRGEARKGASCYTNDMDRSVLLAHLRRTHFAPGDRSRALADASAIARFFREEYGARVFGIGSLFDPDKPFRATSDIDLAVEAIPPDHFFEATGKAMFMTDFELDVIPLEDAHDYLRRIVAEKGVEL